MRNKMKKTIVLIPVSLMLLLSFSAMLVPAEVQAQQLPENSIELKISNSLNETRTDEPVIMRMVNLTQAGLPEDANTDSFRITDAAGNEVPSQYDDLSDYGYEKYLAFPATVPGQTNATYFLYYTTGSWTKPEYAIGVPITETETEYTFTANTYSGKINKSNGEFYFLKTNHSGNLLLPPGLYGANRGSCGFGSSNFGATGWEYGWFQFGIDDAQTTLLTQGPLRSIIVVEGELWYASKPDIGSSNWSFTSIYLLYKDRVEQLTHQVYGGTRAMQLMQARVGINWPVSWLLGAKATLDTPTEPYTEPIQDPYSGYTTPWSEWAGSIMTIYSERDSPDYGKFADITSANQSFGLGFIIYNSAEIDRIEFADGRSETPNPELPPGDYIELHIMQHSAWPSGPIPPGFEALYHWTLLPHENKDYTYTQAEAEKAYHPLGFYAKPPPPPPPPVPVWIVYGIFFAAAAAIVVLFARKLRS